LKNAQFDCIAANGASVFAVAGDREVFRSTDNGETWSAAAAGGLTGVRIQCLTASDPNLFAGTYSSGVYRSADNGAQWIPLNNGLTSMCVNCLLTSGPNLFAGTNNGVFILRSGAAGWKPLDDSLTNLRVNCLAAIGPNLYAGTSDGIFVFQDGGINLKTARYGLPPSGSIVYLAVSGTDLVASFVGAQAEENGVFISSDKGVSWSKVGFDRAIVKSLSVYGSSLFAAATPGGVFVSSESSPNWTEFNGGLPQKTTLTVVSLLVNGTKLFAGTHQGLFQCTLP
jgi:hypothetical protein